MGLARYFGCAAARKIHSTKWRENTNVVPRTSATANSHKKDIADIVVDQEMIDFSKKSHAWSVDNQIKLPDISLKDPNILAAIKVCGV
jgi:hypothetical protein